MRSGGSTAKRSRLELLLGHRLGDPVREHVRGTGAVAELRLAAPQELLAAASPRTPRAAATSPARRGPRASRRRQPQRVLDHLAVEERHARLEAERHRHAVAALEVQVVQALDATGSARPAATPRPRTRKVLVAGEQLVGALAGQHDLHVLRGELARACGSAPRCARATGRTTRSRAPLGHRGRRLLGRVDALVVLGAEVLGDRARGEQVGRALGADRERLQPLAARRRGSAARSPRRARSRARRTGTRRRARRPSSGARPSAQHVARAPADLLGRAGVASGRPAEPRARRRRTAPGRAAASSSGRAGTPRRSAASRGRRRPSRRRSATLPPRWAQYSGLMPTGSRAARKRPSRPASTNANMPLSSVERVGPVAGRPGAARPRCRTRSGSSRGSAAR